MSETVQLDQLLDEKSSVEDEGQRFDEAQRELNLRAKALTKKIILELRKKNSAKQKSVNQLQIDVNDLESQLNALTVSTVLGDISESVENGEETGEVTETIIEESVETVKDTVSIADVTEEIDTDSKHKKKRGFF